MSLITYLTRIQFEPGAASLIGEELALLGASRPLVVTDKGIVAAGIIDRVLKTAGLDRATPVFDGRAQDAPGPVRGLRALGPLDVGHIPLEREAVEPVGLGDVHAR